MIERVSPTPYAPSVAATDEKPGALASTITVPKSPPVTVVSIVLPAASFIVAPPAVGLMAETDKSVESVSPEAIVVLNTMVVDPEPLV